MDSNIGFVPLDEIIATAQSTVKGADSNFRLLCRQWLCRLALPELGVSADDIKVAEILPVNFVAPKPPDFKLLVDISLFDASGNSLDHVYRSGGKRIYRDTRVIQEATTADDVTLNNRVPVDVGSDAYNFHLGTNGDNVHSMVIRYYAYPFDEKGLPLIRQEEAMACVFFCKFMWAFRTNDNRSEIEQFRQIWAAEADRVRAKKKMASISPELMKTIIQKIWMRAIPSFDRRTF